MKKLCFLIPVLLIASVLFCKTTVCARQDAVYVNAETGYAAYIDNGAGLGIATERLEEAMIPVTRYGGVAFVSASPDMQADRYAEKRYREFFGTDSGTLFLIDMRHRYIWIFSDGDMYKTVTTGYANIITDNVYRYASRGDYTTCAVTAFEQIVMLMENRRIAQPMKTLNNALLALLCGLALNFIYMVFVTRTKNPTAEEIAWANDWQLHVRSPKTLVISETKTYDPVDSDSGSSSSGGGGGFGGGRSGGGGFSGSSSSGGGGGHRF